MEMESARNLLIALAIGALVGVEREKKKASDPSPSFGGIRTHLLIALLGAASAHLSRNDAVPWTFLVTLAFVAAAVVASYLRQNRDGNDTPGLTSEFAAVVVFLLAAMAVSGDAALAVALTVATSALLAFKQPLHRLVERVGREDLYAGIKLLIASFIVLPLLPDRTLDPWGAINPYKLWLLVILISGLSLVGYVAMRWLGTAHGTAVTGIAGGLVSSTAATLSFARSAAVHAGDAARAQALAAGILLAWGVMVVRLAAVVGIVNRPLLLAAWVPLATLGVATAAFALWHYRAGLAAAKADDDEGVAVGNPFSLSSAMRFGALFAAVLLIVKLAQQHAPGVGLVVVAALAGTVDVDAIALSVASDASGEELPRAGAAIAVAALSNTVVKCGLVMSLGDGPVRRHVLVATAVIVAAGGAAVAWLP